MLKRLGLRGAAQRAGLREALRHVLTPKRRHSFIMKIDFSNVYFFDRGSSMQTYQKLINPKFPKKRYISVEPDDAVEITFSDYPIEKK